MNRREFMKRATVAALASSVTSAPGGVMTLSGSSVEKARAVQGGGILYARKISVKHDVDVFIAGGGPAGVAAAVAAARQGARVFLAEGTRAWAACPRPDA